MKKIMIMIMACCLLVIGCGKKVDRSMVADDNALAVMDSESKIDTIKKDYHIKGSLYHTYYGDVDLDTCKSDEDVDGNKIYLVKVYPKLRSWVQGRMVDGPYEKCTFVQKILRTWTLRLMR